MCVDLYPSTKKTLKNRFDKIFTSVLAEEKLIYLEDGRDSKISWVNLNSIVNVVFNVTKTKNMILKCNEEIILPFISKMIEQPAAARDIIVLHDSIIYAMERIAKGIGCLQDFDLINANNKIFSEINTGFKLHILVNIIIFRIFYVKIHLLLKKKLA